MSLSARIALAPSRGVARLERAVAIGGIAVAATFAIGRWPSAAGSVVAVAAASAAIAIAVGRRRSRDRPLTIAVSDSDEVRLPTPPSGLPADGWRLDESTVWWPSLAVVALRHAQGGRCLRRVVWPDALPSHDRWALARFLGWSLRSRPSADGRQGR